MRIVIREINYREVEVPENTTIDDVEDMIREGDIIVGDTVDSDYSVLFLNKKQYEHVCQKWRILNYEMDIICIGF